MAKRRNSTKLTPNRIKEALDIGEEIADKTSSTPTKKKKKEAPKRLEIRIPQPLFKRLKKLSDDSGFSLTSIILRGLEKELDEKERKNS